LIVVASERRASLEYHHRGRYRQGDTNCLFQFTLKGQGLFVDADGEHPIPAGHGFLCRTQDPRTEYLFPPDATEPWEFVYLCLNGGGVSAMVDDLVARHGPIYSLPLEHGLIPRLLAWRNYDRTTSLLSPAESCRMAMEIVSALAESKDNPSDLDPSDVLAMRAMRVVRENLDRTLSVSDLAERLDVSREHLTRVFREETSQTPYQFILRQKMLLAARLLKETTLPNKQIAGRLGYSSSAHFTRTFKHVMQMTPRRFRDVGVVPMQ
jgi:AraC-like DNA-binding protein